MARTEYQAKEQKRLLAGIMKKEGNSTRYCEQLRFADLELRNAETSLVANDLYAVDCPKSRKALKVVLMYDLVVDHEYRCGANFQW